MAIMQRGNWQGDMMHGEVNMINSNAALDGGKRNGVSGADAQGTLTHTVCLSALDTGDFPRVGSASDVSRASALALWRES